MKANEYLKARQIKSTKLQNAKIGRLSIDEEFQLSGKRGVIIRPKRGTVSDRYLNLLNEDGVHFVVVENSTDLLFFSKLEKRDGIIPVRALTPTTNRFFPTIEILNYLYSQLRYAVKKNELVRNIVSNIIIERISDEKEGALNHWTNSFADPLEDCSELLKKIVEKEWSSFIDIEAILKVCAIIAGFRISPNTNEESILLLDLYGRFHDAESLPYGFPPALVPFFKAIGERSENILIASSAIGAQFSALTKKSSGLIIIEKGNPETLTLLQILFPNMCFAAGSFLDYKTDVDDTFDTIILIPPIGMFFSALSEVNFTVSFFKNKTVSTKYPAEYLYTFRAIEQCRPDRLIAVVLPEGILSGASHKAFRDWLLDAVQILGVVSLPPGFCFSGTGIRCSILFMKKAKQLPDDYSISMIELEQEDFDSEEIIGRIKELGVRS